MTIAIWCILIAAALPYVAFGFVKGIDPKQPRLTSATLKGGPRAPTAPISTASRLFRGSPRP